MASQNIELANYSQALKAKIKGLQSKFQEFEILRVKELEEMHSFFEIEKEKILDENKRLKTEMSKNFKSEGNVSKDIENHLKPLLVLNEELNSHNKKLAEELFTFKKNFADLNTKSNHLYSENLELKDKVNHLVPIFLI